MSKLVLLKVILIEFVCFIVTWIWSGNDPWFTFQVHKEVGTRRVGFWCVKEWERPAFSKTYEVFMLLLIFTIPIAIISFAYINICKELWHMTSQRNSLRAEKKWVAVKPITQPFYHLLIISFTHYSIYFSAHIYSPIPTQPSSSAITQIGLHEYFIRSRWPIKVTMQYTIRVSWSCRH